MGYRAKTKIGLGEGVRREGGIRVPRSSFRPIPHLGACSQATLNSSRWSDCFFFLWFSN